MWPCVPKSHTESNETHSIMYIAVGMHHLFVEGFNLQTGRPVSFACAPSGMSATSSKHTHRNTSHSLLPLDIMLYDL